MKQVEVMTTARVGTSMLCLVDQREQVWLTFSEPWWNLPAWLWWWLLPSTKAWIIIRQQGGSSVRVRVAMIAKSYLRIGS